MGWRVAEDGERVAAAFRTTTTPAIARAAITAFAASDLRPLLPSVVAPAQSEEPIRHPMKMVCPMITL
jgi:hypothetical protein